MSKYYMEVGELKDWQLKIKDSLANNNKMTEALSAHFTIENQLVSLNQMSEIFLKVLDGQQYNNFID